MIIRVKKSIETEFKNQTFSFIKELKNKNITPLKDKSDVTIKNFVEVHEDYFIAFVPIKSKNFYITFLFLKNNIEKVIEVNLYPNYDICYSVSSSTLTLEELSNLTSLTPSRKNRMGDKTNSPLFPFHTSNSLHFEPDCNKPNLFHVKLKKLLTSLKSDTTHIKAVSKKTRCYNIWVTVNFNSDYPLTDLTIDKEDISILEKLGLSVVFDIYAE